jgi:hypothetical protein
LSALVVTFSCFHFTPGLAFGEKDIGHPAITEYLSLTRQGKLQNRKIISERKQIFTEILYRSRGPTKNQFLSDLTYFCWPIFRNSDKGHIFRFPWVPVIYRFQIVLIYFNMFVVYFL